MNIAVSIVFPSTERDPLSHMLQIAIIPRLLIFHLSAYAVEGIAWLAFLWPTFWGGCYEKVAWVAEIHRCTRLIRCT